MYSGRVERKKIVHANNVEEFHSTAAETSPRISNKNKKRIQNKTEPYTLHKDKCTEY